MLKIDSKKTLLSWPALLLFAHSAGTQAQRMVLQREAATVVVEGYAPGIVRITLSLEPKFALQAPGPGISASANEAGWNHSTTSTGDTYRSSDMVVRIAASRPATAGSGGDIAKYFNGSTPYVGLAIDRTDGKPVLRMSGWEMANLNHKDGNAAVLEDRRSTDDPFFEVGASFAAPNDEHYYGLGQNQQGVLDLRGRSIDCAHDYNAAAGPSVCVPFVVTNKGYALLWDNPSKTRVDFAFNEQTRWTSQVGQRVSFFVIVGDTYDNLYEGIVCSPEVFPCFPNQPTDTFSASSATVRKRNCST